MVDFLQNNSQIFWNQLRKKLEMPSNSFKKKTFEYTSDARKKSRRKIILQFFCFRKSSYYSKRLFNSTTPGNEKNLINMHCTFSSITQHQLKNSQSHWIPGIFLTKTQNALFAWNYLFRYFKQNWCQFSNPMSRYRVVRLSNQWKKWKISAQSQKKLRRLTSRGKWLLAQNVYSWKKVSRSTCGLKLHHAFVNIMLIQRALKRNLQNNCHF